MNILRGSSSGPAKRSRQTCLPPGLNRPATSASLPPGSTRPASSASRHPLPSLAAVMSAPERRNMPLLHPQRPNGTLWFGIDDCIRKDVVSTYQSNFWGPWWTYRMVPDEKKVAWWTSFLQQYYWDPKHHSQVRFQMNLVATNGKGRVYGLGSIQDIDDEPSETAPASLFTHVAVDGRLTTMEGVVTCLKDDVSGLKEDVIGIKRGIEVLMKMNGVDPVTFEPIQLESDASVRTPQSSQELDQNSPVH
ncbi:hypothetical protein HID58_056331 [Brassica napus]|uniref:Uncharacterized protein n=1 Tax=Brassica napus TaxID=3708 RepID=A0ABQ8ANX2_BRANA|nr:hypothetical protein HID58_056331 [Brassica napus]